MSSGITFLITFFLSSLNVTVPFPGLTQAPPELPIEQQIPDARQPIDLDSSYTARSILIFDLTTKSRIADLHAEDIVPIASLSKIMTGFVALKWLDPEEKIVMSKEVIATSGAIGDLRAEEVFTFRDLLAAMMTASSNDAAMAVAEEVGERLGGKTYQERISLFVDAMNRETTILGMRHTTFQNPTGLDRVPGEASNFSTASDLADLVEATQQMPLLWELSRDARKNIYSSANRLHSLFNINTLADRIPYFIGSKTGSTDSARESVVILYEYPLGRPQALILLGADSGRRFIEAAALLNQAARMLP